MENSPSLSSEWFNEMDRTLDNQAAIRPNQGRQDLQTSNTPAQQDPLFLPNMRSSTEGGFTIDGVSSPNRTIHTPTNTASEGAGDFNSPSVI